MNRAGKSNAQMVDHYITPEFLGSVEALMAVLQYVSSVCEHLFLARSTFYAWYRAGKLLYHRVPAHDISPREQKLIRFYVAIRRGRCRGRQLDLENIKQAGEKNWRAAAWRLERRYPELWGRNRKPTDKAQREAARARRAKIRERQLHEAHEVLAELERDREQDLAADRAALREKVKNFGQQADLGKADADSAPAAWATAADGHAAR